MPSFSDPGPVLSKVPDARVAPFSMLSAVTYLYLSLLIGIVPTSLLLVGSALALRRPGLAAAGLGIGLLGFFAPLLLLLVLEAAGVEQGPVLLLTRLLSVALGFWAYKLAQPHVRGHLQLEGRQVPLIWAIGPAFAAVLFLPGSVAYALIAPALFLITQTAG